MPLPASQLADLQAAVQALGVAVLALVADVEPNPLQVELDAAKQTIASLNAMVAARDADLLAVSASKAQLQAAMDAAKQDLLASKVADAAEDAGRDAALAKLGG